MITKKTTIKITEDTRDQIKLTKNQFRYSNMDELLSDCCQYFLNHNQSPKEIKEPIGKLFTKFSDRFFQAFNKTNRDILNPFIKDSYTFYNHALEYLENTSAEKTEENPPQSVPQPKQNTETSNHIEDYHQQKQLILELDKIKNNTTENGVSYIKIPTLEYNRIMDKIKLM